MAAKTKEPLWAPPEDVVRELLDAAAEKMAEDAIFPADTVKPTAEPLRAVINGRLCFGLPGEECVSSEVIKAHVFACLKAALIQADGEHKMRESIRESYEREEKRAEERLDILKTVAFEMLESYGEGEKLEIHTPIGDLRRQKNSQPFVWVDLDRINEIPEKIGEFQLVKIEKRPSKTGIGAYLEDLEEQGQPKPDWAEIQPPGWHLRYS